MRALAAHVLLAMPLMNVPAQTAPAQTTPAATTTLAALRDQARPLLIFAGPNDPRVEQQYAELAAHAPEMSDRDMRLAFLVPSAAGMHKSSRTPQADFSQAEQQHLRMRFHVRADEFAVILVGKDGEEKLRSSKPVSWQKLASTIDAMPMRRDEMRAR